MFFSNPTWETQVAAALQACKVSSSAAACRGVGRSLTCAVNFTTATLPATRHAGF